MYVCMMFSAKQIFIETWLANNKSKCSAITELHDILMFNDIIMLNGKYDHLERFADIQHN